MFKCTDETELQSGLKPAKSYTSSALNEPVLLRISKEGINSAIPKTIPQFFRKCCEQYAHLPALAFKLQDDNGNCSDAWTIISYADYMLRVEQAALVLMHMGLQPRTTVCVLANSCPEWFYVEFGTLLAGGVLAGIYTTYSPEAVCHALKTAEAVVCVVDDATQLAKVRAVRSQLPKLKSVIQLHGPFDDLMGKEQGYYRWKDLVSMRFEDSMRQKLKEREQNVAPNECAMLVFTSGTTGMPKAVMLSHDSFTVRVTKFVYADGDCDETIAYLPLCHIAAQKCDIFTSANTGGCVYFADRDAICSDLIDMLLQVRPTRICGVPRIIEKIYQRIVEVELASSRLPRYFRDWAKQTILEHRLSGANEKKKWYNSLKFWVASKVIQQIKSTIGMERCEYLTSLGAPQSPARKHFFLSLNLPLLDFYGTTEACGAVTFSDGIRDMEGVGKLLGFSELKIDKPNVNGHGEVCIRGRSCFMGYLNEPEKTAEVLNENGWLHTGDVGYLDKQGNLNLTGRLKEIIITAGGENIPPLRIENLVKAELPCLSNVLLVGDQRKYLTMLVTMKTQSDPQTGASLDALQPDAVTWLKRLGFNYTRLSEVLRTNVNGVDKNSTDTTSKPDQRILDALQAGLDRANAMAISRAQRVQKLVLLPNDFTVATGELGPTMKMRRNFILQKYANVIEELYK